MCRSLKVCFCPAAVRTRTFTRWMNLFLQKVRHRSTCLFLSSLNFRIQFANRVFPICSIQSDPPVAVHDLFTDIQDGRALMVLLEELSGCKLVRVVLNVGTIWCPVYLFLYEVCLLWPVRTSGLHKLFEPMELNKTNSEPSQKEGKGPLVQTANVKSVRSS